MPGRVTVVQGLGRHGRGDPPPRGDREQPGVGLPGGGAELEAPPPAPLPDLLDILLENGRVTACTQCAARRGIGPDDVLTGIRIAGAAVFVEEIMTDGAQALVY